MKTHLLGALICALPFFSLAQSNTSIDLLVGGDLSYRTTRIDENDGAAQFQQEILNENIVMKPSWRIGLNINQKLAGRFYLRTGVQFANMGIRSRMSPLMFPDQMGPTGPLPTPATASQSRARWSYHFIQVPVVGRVELGAGKVVPFIEIGVLPSIYLFTQYTLKSGQEVLTSNRRKEDPEIYSYFQLAGLISAGINYQLTEKLQLFGQPIFRYHFTPQAPDALVVQNLYNVGIEAGVRRKL